MVAAIVCCVKRLFKLNIVTGYTASKITTYFYSCDKALQTDWHVTEK